MAGDENKLVVLFSPAAPPRVCNEVGRLLHHHISAFDGWSLRSLVPLHFLERHRGRDQIDLSVTVSRKNPVEGRGLRGIRAAQQSEDPTPAGTRSQSCRT